MRIKADIIIMAVVLTIGVSSISYATGYYFRDDFDGTSLGFGWTVESGNVTVSGGTAIIDVPGTLKFNTELSQYDEFIQVAIRMTAANAAYPTALELAKTLYGYPGTEWVFHTATGKLNPRSVVEGGWEQTWIDYPDAVNKEQAWIVLGIMPTAGGIKYYVKAGRDAFDPNNLPPPVYISPHHTKSDMTDNYYCRFTTVIGGQNFEIDWFQVGNVPDDCAEVWVAGYGIPGDLDGNCRVDAADLALMCLAWLDCNNPGDGNCVPTW